MGGPYQRTQFSKLLVRAIRYSGFTVFSGSVKSGSDRWRFLGLCAKMPPVLLKRGGGNKKFHGF